MQQDSTESAVLPFDCIEDDFLDRLSKEAEQRTLKPEDVDWKAIHHQAMLARQKL